MWKLLLLLITVLFGLSYAQPIEPAQLLRLVPANSDILVAQETKFGGGNWRGGSYGLGGGYSPVYGANYGYGNYGGYRGGNGYRLGWKHG